MSNDISGYPFEPNDLVVLYDHLNESSFRLKIIKVQKIDEFIKRLSCLVLSSNNPSIKKGSTYDINIDARVQVQGVVIKANAPNGTIELKPAEVNALIIEKTKEFLDGREEHKFGAPVNIIVSHLTSLGYLPNMEYDDAKKKLLKLVKSRSDWFSNRGGRVFSIVAPKGDSLPELSNLTTTRLVDWKQVDIAFDFMKLALKHLVRSGLLGDARIINQDVE